MFARLRAAAALAALLCLVPRAGHAQIPNSGFETWAAGNPTGWATSNVAPVLVNVTQSTTKHSGSSAVRGDVASLFSTLVQPVLQAGPTAQGFAYSQRPAQFTGYYQFHPVSGDQFAINVILFKGGVTGTPVAFATAALPTTVTSYTQFSVPFAYESALSPDTCIIQIQIVGPNGSDFHLGSYFLLDDIAFSGTVSVDGGPAPAAITLSQNTPNPFGPATTLRYELSRRSDVTLAVFDMQGREVATLVHETRDPGGHVAVWDSRKQAAGIYYCRLAAGSLTATRMLVLAR